MEMDLIEQSMGIPPQGSATWIAWALKVEEAQVTLWLDVWRIDTRGTETQMLDISCRRDKLQSQINGLVQAAAQFLGEEWDGLIFPADGDSEDDSDNTFFLTSTSPGNAEVATLPLPSYMGMDACRQLGLEGLANQELLLWQGQANDALHEIRLALADKAVLFRTEVRHGRNYTMVSRAWKKVTDTEAVVKRHAAVYQHCHRQMILIGANSDLLAHYQPLDKKDLRVSTAVSDPNARGHRQV